MDEIGRLFPGLVFDHVRVLADVVAVQRNLVREVNRVFGPARWGQGCMAYDWARVFIKQLAQDGDYRWLEYIQENGTGYTVRVDGAPLRIQRDEPEIRSVLPGERAAMLQLLMPVPGMADPGVVLRLEITQPSGKPVEMIVLYLFEEETGATLDSEIVYQLPDADSGATDLPPTGSNAIGLGSAGAKILPFVRPGQDADPTTRFKFNDPDAVKDGDGDDEK